jgi:hypothetical protein
MQVIAAVKTMDQMQKEADSSGWFRVDTEWSWWYPWFRLHYKLDVNLPQGNPKLDYGWSPLPFGCSYNANTATLASVMNSAAEGSDPQALAMFFGAATVPFLIQAVAAIVVGQTVAGIGWAVLLYAIALGGLTLATCINANGNPNYWLMAFLSAAFVEMAELFLPLGSATDIYALLNTVVRGAMPTVLSALQTVLDNLGFLSVTGAIFALMDFAAMVFYLGMYLTSL